MFDYMKNRDKMLARSELHRSLKKFRLPVEVSFENENEEDFYNGFCNFLVFLETINAGELSYKNREIVGKAILEYYQEYVSSGILDVVLKHMSTNDKEILWKQILVYYGYSYDDCKALNRAIEADDERQAKVLRYKDAKEMKYQESNLILNEALRYGFIPLRVWLEEKAYLRRNYSGGGFLQGIGMSKVMKKRAKIK